MGFIFLGHEDDFGNVFKPFVSFGECWGEGGVSDDFFDFGEERLVSEVVAHIGVTEQLLENFVHVLVFVFWDLELFDVFDVMEESFVVGEGILSLSDDLVLLVGHYFF